MEDSIADIPEMDDLDYYRQEVGEEPDEGTNKRVRRDGMGGERTAREERTERGECRGEKGERDHV